MPERLLIDWASNALIDDCTASAMSRWLRCAAAQTCWRSCTTSQIAVLASNATARPSASAALR